MSGRNWAAVGEVVVGDPRVRHPLDEGAVEPARQEDRASLPTLDA
eukprot:SAG11_NODE_10703_length_811_cov_1.084270_1_plen_44_part_10